jgi:hypothetical protein
MLLCHERDVPRGQVQSQMAETGFAREMHGYAAEGARF